MLFRSLTNEKYIGNNVYNRISNKLKRKRVFNDPEMWVRGDGAFTAIVDRELFNAAQAILAARARRFSDDELLAMLSGLLASRGALSGLLIDESDEMPSTAAYRHRFGSLVRAYQLIGYTPDRDYRYLETNRLLRLLQRDAFEHTVERIREMAISIEVDPQTDIIVANGEVSISLVMIRCTETAAGSLRWKLRLDSKHRPDITLAVRMNPDNRTVRDYYLLPWLDLGQLATMRMGEENGIALDAYRTDDLDPLYHMLRRHPIGWAA